MASVAKRLVFGAAAAAKGDSIPNFVLGFIGRFNRNFTFVPNWPTDFFLGVFNEADGSLEFRREWLTSFFVAGHKPTGRAIASLANGHLSFLWIIGFSGKAPSSFSDMAEAGHGAKIWRVG